LPTLGLSLGLLSAYPLGFVRVFRSIRRRGRAPRDAALYAAFTQIGRFPEVQGVLQFHRDRFLGKASEIIEYKSVGNRT
jgi:hypothetical protein